MRKNGLITVVLALLFVCALGLSVCLAQDNEPASLYGDYILYSMEYSGSEMNPASMGVTSVLTLAEDGTGTLDMNGGAVPFPKWSKDGEIITLVNDSGDELPCAITNGIIKMEMGENYYWYYAHESLPEAGTSEPSMLSRIIESIDAAEGAHLRYEYHSDYMDSTSVFDAQAKGSSYYSLRTTTVPNYAPQQKAELFLDNISYVLYPDEMRGNIAVTLTSDIIADNILMLDDLYKAIHGCVLRRDFTVETREIDGKSYTAEVFPASGYTAESVFYFDDSGQLLHILQGAPALSPDLGEKFYTIHSIDTDVDMSLFDISGYTIE